MSFGANSLFSPCPILLHASGGARPLTPQCNDAYSALVVAGELAKAFDCSVNELPLSLDISWCAAAPLPKAYGLQG